MTRSAPCDGTSGELPVKLVTDEQDHIVYEGQYAAGGVLFLVLALMALIVGYALWRSESVAGAVFVGALALGLACLGLGLILERTRLELDFVEEVCRYRRSGLGGKAMDLTLPFDEIAGLVLLTWKSTSARYGANSYHLKLRFVNTVFPERPTERNELEIVQSVDERLVKAELRRLSERSRFPVIEETRDADTRRMQPRHNRPGSTRQ